MTADSMPSRTDDDDDNDEHEEEENEELEGLIGLLGAWVWVIMPSGTCWSLGILTSLVVAVDNDA